MKWLHINRRTHLYLGLALLPWLFMYGVSSLAFTHGPYFEQKDKAKGVPLWTTKWERPYTIDVPEKGDLREVGAQIMRDAGLDIAFGAYRPNPNQVNVYAHTFWKVTQFRYLINEKKLISEDRRFRWDHFLTGMHAKGGFENGGLHDLWSWIIDLVCLAMLLWVVTGLIMWWKLPSTHRWGWLAFISGTLSFALFLLRL